MASETYEKPAPAELPDAPAEPEPQDDEDDQDEEAAEEG